MSLAGDLRARGGLLAAAVREDAPTAPADEATAFGPGRETAADAIHEGYLLHYGASRVLAADDDLALLAGDRLYALGLDRLAGAGDLDGVRTLAGVITACAEAHGAGDPDRARAAWRDGAETISR